MDNNHTPPTQAELDEWKRLHSKRADSVKDRRLFDNHAVAYCTDLIREIEEFRKDKERLDWLENNGHRAEAKSTGGIDPRHSCWVVSGTVDDDDRFGRAVALRDAIDAAMQQKGEE